jgi:chemotaxis protein CheX
MTRKTILIVSDDDSSRSKMAQDLTDSTQMLYIQARDGVTAYQKARNQAFDLIICGQEIPKLKGDQLIAAVRDTNHNPHTPFILYEKDLEPVKVLTRGINGIEYIQKPLSSEKMSEKVMEILKRDPQKKRFKLDVDFINPFIESSVKTLNAMCGMKDINAGKPYLYNEEEELNIDISGTLVISSPYFKGSIAISFADNVYKDLINTMLAQDSESIDIDNQEGAAEIINIIFGQTKAELNTRGYNLERAIPSVMRGHNHKINQNNKIPVLLVPFKTDAGDFFIQICVKAI